MNVKYKKYIEYIARDIELPYIKYLEAYGLKQDDYHLVLSKIFNQPVVYIKYTGGVYNKKRNRIYYENNGGYWEKREYDTNGSLTYLEDSDGSWIKREYDANGNKIYYENSDGYIRDYR